jgi:hypothetical protein
MTLTDNQQRFLREQIALWTGAYRDFSPPLDLAELILGVAETQQAGTDHRGNKDFQHNPLFWSGRVLEPVVNQWLKDKLAGREENLPVPLWPDGKRFAVCLTHDVDDVSLTSLPANFRKLKVVIQQARRGNQDIHAIFLSLARLALLVANGQGFKKKKARLFEPWLEAEDQFGFRSTFFFFPEKAAAYHPLDGPFYRLRDKLDFREAWISVAQLIRELDSRGWEVGLHSTFNSFQDPVELRWQKEQLEKCLPGQVVSIRQHCLHFDMQHTPRAQSLAGFKYDTTFGFNRIIGFRNGLALPFYHYDLKADAPLPILQIPLHLQDVALFRKDNLGLSPEEALVRARELIAKVEKVGGLITLIWHPVSVDYKAYSGWFKVYRELLADIRTRDAWVAPVREIGEWWRQRHSLLNEDQRDWPEETETVAAVRAI